MDTYQPQGSRVCYKGLVKSLFVENTFTIIDSFIELYQNSDDAKSTTIKIYIIEYKNKFWLVIDDDGGGMSLKEMDNSLHLLHREGNEKKHGKFNFGGKAGTLFLSGICDYIENEKDDIEYKGSIVVISKSDSDKAVCYNMAGKDLVNNGWLNGAVKPYYTDSDHVSKICDYFVIKEYNGSGTNIYIELTDKMYNELLEKEPEIKTEMQLHCYKRLEHCKLNIQFNESTDINYKDVLQYNDIIDEKKQITKIGVYKKDNKLLFLFMDEGKWYGILPRGKEQWKHGPSVIDDMTPYGDSLTDFNLIQACNYTIGDSNDDKKQKQSRVKTYVSRNGFILNYYENRIQSLQQWIIYYAKGITSIMEYNSSPVLDTIIKINMHKSDIKWKNLPINLHRTIEHIQSDFFKKLKTYVNKYEISEPSPEPPPEPPPEPTPEPAPTPPTPTLAQEHWRGSVPNNEGKELIKKYYNNIINSESDFSGMDLKVMNMIKHII